MASSSSSFLSAFSPASVGRAASGETMSPPSVSCRLVSIFASCATTAERPPPRTLISHRIPSPSSLYEVLGIRSGATCQEIKAAYRRLARVLHPDVAAEDDSTGREFMIVHEAYATLSDPEKRADYDREMMLVCSRQWRRPSPVEAGYGRRNWETDQCW